MMRTRSAMQGRFLLLALLCLLLCGGAAVYADVTHANGLIISDGVLGTDFSFTDEVLCCNGQTSSGNAANSTQGGIKILTSTPLTLRSKMTTNGNYTGIYIPANVTANLTLDNASIGGGNHTAPITVEGTLYLTLTGSNVITPYDLNDGTTVTSTAGIWVLENGSLEITEQSTGSLTITASYENPAIGQTSYATSMAFGTNYVNQEGVNKAGSITINGGILTLTSEGSKPGDPRSYNSGAAIGSAAGGDFTSITINGGVIDAESYTGAAIGAGWRDDTFSAPQGSVTITGGTINATGGQGYTSDGVGGSTNAIDGGVTIKGGSVKNAANYNRPTDGTKDLYLATIKLDGVTSATAITEVKYYVGTTETAYGTENNYAYTNMQTDTSGNLYLWLPERAIVTSVTAGSNNTIYTGSVMVIADDSAAATFKSGVGTYTVGVQVDPADSATASILGSSTVAAGGTVYLSIQPNDGCSLTGISLGTKKNTFDITKMDATTYSFVPSGNTTVYVSTTNVQLTDKLNLANGPIVFGYDDTAGETGTDSTPTNTRYVSYYNDNKEKQVLTGIPATVAYTVEQSNSGTITTNTLTVDGWNLAGDDQPLKLIISNLNINADVTDTSTSTVSLTENLIDIDNSTVELTLDGTSTLTSNVPSNANTPANNRMKALLSVDSTSELTITQASGSNSLFATAKAGYGSVIGGDGTNNSDDNVSCGIINIKGGKISATIGVDNLGQGAAIGGGRYGTGGTVNISGGEVTATSYGSGAAIGSGDVGTAFTVNISGGTVTAKNTYGQTGGGAAIGSGANGDAANVIISGGEIDATAFCGAAIGSGDSGNATVTISNGTVISKAAGANAYGASIGSGNYGNATVTISGGSITASTGGTSGTYAAAIGGGGSGSSSSTSDATVTITGGDINATGSSYTPAIGSGYSRGASASATVTISGGNININSDTATIGCGGNGATATVTITGGSVNGEKRTATTSFTDGNSKEVYLITATLPNTNATVTGSITDGTYGFDGVKTNSEGKIFLWLPTGDASIVLGESKYVGAVTAGSTNTFTRLKNLSELTIELSGDFTYTGSQIRPEVTVKDGDSVVDSSKYTLTYGDNTNAGTGTVTVKAASSSTAYNGEATRLFTIVPVKLEVVSVTTKSNSREYNGSSAVEISGIELNGVLNSEDVSVSTESLLGDLPSANVGDYAFVTLPVLTLTGAGKANYTLSQPSGEVKLAQTFTITKAPAPKPSTVTVSRNYAVAKVSVPTGIVAGEGSTFSVGVASGSGADKVGDADFDAKGNLTFTLSGGAKDDEIVLPVSIHSPNYEGGITTNVTVALTDKLDQRPLRVKVSGDSSGGTLSLSSSGGSGKGTVSYEIVSGTESISVSGNVLTASGPGTAMVIATKEGTGQYNPARSSALVVTRTEDGKFIVDSNEDSNDAVDNSAAGSGPSASVMSSVVLPVDSSTWGYSTDKLNQRPLTVKASSTTVPSGGILELSASGGSGKGAVSYEVIKGTGSASVSGSTLTGGSPGTVTVIATKAGTGQYNPSRSQPLVITVE